MSNEEKEYIIIPGENGEELLFEELFTFEMDTTGDKYMILIPADQAEDEEVDVYPFRYEEQGDEYTLFELESEEEWDYVEEVLNTLAEEDSDVVTVDVIENDEHNENSNDE